MSLDSELPPGDDQAKLILVAKEHKEDIMQCVY